MTRSRLPRLAWLVLPVAMLVTPQAVAAGHHSGASNTAASCQAPAAVVGSSYLVTGSQLPASHMVQFLVTDSSGAESSTTVMTDSTGTASVAGHAWTAGTDAVTITDTDRKWTTLATCSFQVS